MSLTGLLASNKEVKDFFKNIKPDKKEFYTLSGKKPFSREYEIKLPYNLEVPYDSTLVGTAFDYMARFEIARNINFNKEQSYKMLYNGIPKSGLKSVSFNIFYKPIISILEIELNKALDIAKQYVNSQIDDFEILLEKSLYLARLEHFYRAGVIGVYDILNSNGMHLKCTSIKKENISEIDNLIEIKGVHCCLSTAINNDKDVTIIIEEYDKNKNVINSFESEKYNKKIELNNETVFIKLNIMKGKKKIDLEDIISIWIEYMSDEDVDNVVNFFTKFNQNITNELKNIFVQFKESFVKTVVKKESIVVFNPTFGKASTLVNGADADVYIDGVLYDFKTTKQYGYAWKDIAQIIGYFLLKGIDEKYVQKKDVNQDSESPLLNHHIDKLAFYKARFGEIEFLDVSYLDNFGKDKLINDFENLLNR